MDWKVRWEETEGNVSWQAPAVDQHLQDHLKDLTVVGGATTSIFVPWCGKSLDVPWLSSQGYDVVGVELSEIGVVQLFEENGIPYSVTEKEGFSVYEAKDRKMKVFLGDFYNLTPGLVGVFEAVWDNNAFGAAEVADREKYISVLLSILTPKGRILLGNWEYGNKVRHSAPFSLPSELVFCDNFDVQFLKECEAYTDRFVQRFGVDWARRNIHLLSREAKT
jgi:thiopurine S-methyltransferase